jgi:hypothetical protein
VVEEQNSDGFSSDTRDQAPFDRFLCHQTHRPARPALGRIAAYHSDNPLLLSLFEHGRRPRPLLFVERRYQPALPITMAHFASGLWREWDHVGNLRGAGALGQLQQR